MRFIPLLVLVALALVASCSTFTSAEGSTQIKSLTTDSQREVPKEERRQLKETAVAVNTVRLGGSRLKNAWAKVKGSPQAMNAYLIKMFQSMKGKMQGAKGAGGEAIAKTTDVAGKSSRFAKVQEGFKNGMDATKTKFKTLFEALKKSYPGESTKKIYDRIRDKLKRKPKAGDTPDGPGPAAVPSAL